MQKMILRQAKVEGTVSLQAIDMTVVYIETGGGFHDQREHQCLQADRDDYGETRKLEQGSQYQGNAYLYQVLWDDMAHDIGLDQVIVNTKFSIQEGMVDLVQ